MNPAHVKSTSKSEDINALAPFVGICRCVDRAGRGGMIESSTLLRETTPSCDAVRDALEAVASPVSPLNSLDKCVTRSVTHTFRLPDSAAGFGPSDDVVLMASSDR